MQSKNALTNLINRYKAVLKKCNILNNFGTLLKRSAMTAGFVAVLASPALSPNAAKAFQIDCVTSGSSTICVSSLDSEAYFSLEPVRSGANYVSTMSLPGSGVHGLLYKNPADQATYSDINALLGAIIPRTVDGRYAIGQGAAPAGSIAFNTVVNGVTTPYYVTPLQTPSLANATSTLSGDINGGAFYGISGGNGGAIQNLNQNGGYNINADFFDNEATANGAAFFNNANTSGGTASIGNVTASFIANRAHSNGGAFYSQAVDNSTASIGNINASFIANTAGDSGGAFVNYASVANATASIGNINASFIANTAGRDGGAFFNQAFDNATASIGDINASFIANRAGGDGGAFYNYASGDNSTASIGNINASFITNTAGSDGGAFYNAADGDNTTASIGNLTASFIANTASRHGGAFYNFTLVDNSTASIGDINASFIANTAGYDGGAFINFAQGNNAKASIGNINASFIANTATIGHGGAFYNYANGASSTASIGNINASFIANTADAIGGAFYNWASATNSIASIGNINASFIANTAGTSGGAFYNFALGDNSTASIGNINASFIANRAGNNGGAFYNWGANGSTASIGNINADFIDNIADTNKTNALFGLGGAIFTNRSLNFLADSKTNIFSGNMDSTGYNAIYIEDSGHNVDLALNFTMQNVGSFMLNDSITTNVAGAYDVNIAGQDANINFDNFNERTYKGQRLARNNFYLNNVIDDADNVNVSAATLRLGTVNHAEQKFIGGINANNTNINYGGMLEVAVGHGNTAHINSNLNINNGGSFKATSGRLNNANVNFASNSLFIHDADTMGNAVGLVSTGGTLNVASGAKLQVLSSLPTHAVAPLTLVSGFTSSATSVHGWTPFNTQFTSPSSLQRLQLNPFDYGTGSLTAQVVNNTAAGIARDYSKMQGKTTEFLSNVSADVNSQNPGVRLMSRAADERYVGRTDSKDAARIIEGSLQVGNLADVAKSGFNAGLASSGSVISRLSPSGFGTGAGTGTAQAPAVAMLNDSTEQAMAGVAAGSNMMGSSSGIQDGLSLWLMPLYKHSTMHGVEAGKFDHSSSSDLGGLSLGADYTFSEMFRLGLALNIGTGFSRSTGDFDETTNDFDFWGASLYGGFYKNNFALMADVGVNKVFGEVYQDLDSSVQMSTLKASTESTVWTAGLTAEYTFNTSFMDITPHASVRYMNVQTYGYDVKSGGTVAEMEAENQGVWYFPVGVSFTKDFVTASGWSFTPKVDLGFIAAAGDLDTTAKASIAEVAGSVDYTMQNVDGFAFNGGLGLEIAKDDFSMGLNYNLQASEHETGHMLFATFKYSF